MIFNMDYWQSELRRISATLGRHREQRRWVAASDSSVEKAVMIGFYAVRKMLQSFNPPPALEGSPKLRVTTFPRNSTKVPPSDMFWPEVPEAFDLTKPRGETLKLEVACNQIIHGLYFSLWFGPNRILRGIFVCSDHRWEEKIFRIELQEIIELFVNIANSDRKIVRMKFAPDRNRVMM